MRSFTVLLLALPLMAGRVQVYVANSDGDNITIIDPGSNTVTGEMKVSRNPHGIVPSPDGKRFYVSSESEDVLDVIERNSGHVIKRVPLGRRPNNVAITEDGLRVYVCIRQESVVDVVDTGSLEVVKRIEVGRNPHNVYRTPDGKHMIATSMGDNKLTVINAATDEPEFTIPLDGVPRPIAIDAGPDLLPKRLFVQLSNLHGFDVVDYEGRKSVARILLPAAPKGAKPLIAETFSHGIAIAPDRKTLWVNSMLDNSVTVYSLPDLRHLGTTPVGRGPDWMTFTPDGKLCYISDAGADSVSAIDATTRKEVARIPVGRIPKRIIATD